MTACRSVDEVRAAAAADARDDPPLPQATADLAAAILAAHHAPDRAAS